MQAHLHAHTHKHMHTRMCQAPTHSDMHTQAHTYVPCSHACPHIHITCAYVHITRHACTHTYVQLNGTKNGNLFSMTEKLVLEPCADEIVVSERRSQGAGVRTETRGSRRGLGSRRRAVLLIYEVSAVALGPAPGTCWEHEHCM